jgi:hypothetical protein
VCKCEVTVFWWWFRVYCRGRNTRVEITMSSLWDPIRNLIRRTLTHLLQALASCRRSGEQERKL